MKNEAELIAALMNDEPAEGLRESGGFGEGDETVDETVDETAVKRRGTRGQESEGA